MITRQQLVEIGRFGQPHGIKGEVNALIDDGIDLAEVECVVVDMDGIYVPFFIASARRRGAESWLVTIDDITDEKQANGFRGKTVYVPKDRMPDYEPDSEEDDAEGFYAEDLVGFKVEDAEAGLRGSIEDIDDSTDNVLFIILTDDGRRVLVPVADDFISYIDTENQTVGLSLPAGLIDLN